MGRPSRSTNFRIFGFVETLQGGFENSLQILSSFDEYEDISAQCRRNFRQRNSHKRLSKNFRAFNPCFNKSTESVITFLLVRRTLDMTRYSSHAA